MEELRQQVQLMVDDLRETKDMLIKMSEERIRTYEEMNKELDEMLARLKKEVYGNK